MKRQPFRGSDVRRLVCACTALLPIFSPGAAARAQDSPVAFVGARLIPIVGEEIERGVLVVSGGRIVGVGREGDVVLPDGAQRIDAAGKIIMPGLVDTHNHVGGIGGADSTAPIQADVRVWESTNVRDAGFRRVVAGGLTTLNLMPGSGHLLSGQTVYVKMRRGRTIDELAVRDAEGKIMGGIKMANGTNSFRDAPFPTTRAKSAALVRAQYVKAQEYREKWKKLGDDPARRPDRDPALEALVEVLEGKRIVHHHTHRHDDILTVLRLAKEFGFRVVLHHVSEAWKVPHEIAAAGAPCSIIVVDSPGGKLEASEITFQTGAILERAGVNVAIHTDDWINDSRWFFRSAALAVRGGMTRGGALRALTLSGAEMLDLASRIGSLEVGKDADFIVLSGDPFSVYTKVLETWVEGIRVFDRSDPRDYLHAVGGYGAGNDQEPYFCCFDHPEGQ